MNFQALLDAYRQDPRTQKIVALTNAQSPAKLHLNGITASLPAIILAATYLEKGQNHVVILNDKEEAAYFLNDLESLLPKKDLLFFPDSFKRPLAIDVVHPQNARLRTETIKNLANSQTRGEIVVTYPEALLEKVVDQKVISSNAISIAINTTIDADEILDTLVELDFESVDFVYQPGQFSQRGGIVDIFSYGNEMPYRIELFGDEVESIRVFNPLTQESEKKIRSISIIPNLQAQATEEQRMRFLELLPTNACVWTSNLALTLETIEEGTKTLHALLEEAELEEEHPFFLGAEDVLASAKDTLADITKNNVIEFGLKSYFNDEDIRFSIEKQPHFNKSFNLLIENISALDKKGITTLIFSKNTRQHERLNQIFEDLDAKFIFHPIATAIHEGFVDLDNKIACYTDHQIFERYHKYNLKQGHSGGQALTLKTLMELTPGDYVTHIDHGIGEFSGLQSIEVNGKKQDSVRLIYKDGDILYVGINALYKIARYTGKDGIKPRIDKLGSSSWQKLKNKTKKKVKDIAKDLIKLYAKRKATKGFAFEEDSYLQLELESSFIYEDTPDQAKASEDVKADMEKSYPMDRLVCGDVGFGKTEVAIRAAFKAVADSKQVAVLVPTTILALQHYKTFKERLGDLPCNVDYINRFKSTKEKNETLQKLENGQVDILIGTHAIVGKKVKFKDLGLLIIDEEQKFGVGVKEKLRQLKANVDTLTLTATPIPRTLQFSLMGARDLSIMRTPPPNRQPITTEIKLFNEEWLQDVIQYEVYRGGQVFFVHNRVKDIHRYAEVLKRIVPDVSVGIAHGQLEGHELEEALFKFINREYDVLLSTNIVESGLDIPNANTIIVNNAHMFGLSDLHQLRGRVGRSNKKAFAYLIAPPLSTLTQEGRKRLHALEQFSELGSGFHIAMRDLDIRGAGNILGAEQSGFIADIGLHTFQKILDEAINELKQGEFKDVYKEELESGQAIHVTDCQIDSDIEMRFPDRYVASNAERLLLYTDLNAITKEEDLNKFGHHIKDRFGPIPKPVLELFDGIRIQWLAKRIGFQRIIIKSGLMRCYFVHDPESPYFESATFGRILTYIQENPSLCQVKQTPKNLSLTFRNVKDMQYALSLLQQMRNFVSAETVVNG